MKPFDPEGRMGPSKNVPDAVTMVEWDSLPSGRCPSLMLAQSKVRGHYRDPFRTQGPPSAGNSPANAAAAAAAAGGVDRRVLGVLTGNCMIAWSMDTIPSRHHKTSIIGPGDRH